ncbi:MAG: M56 family metallopeptidase [Sporichthyaceae bacterium]
MTLPHLGAADVVLVIGVLLAYAGALAVGADRVLSRSSWVVRTPRTALVVWHACAFTFLATLAGVLALVGHDKWEHAVVRFFHADKGLVHAAYAGSWYAVEVTYVALLALLATSTALAGLAFRRFRSVRRAQSRHRLLTDAIASPGSGTLERVCVLEESRPAAFCVPGSRRTSRVVLTRGALALLDPDEVAAAVAHERGHLRFGHHRLIVLADVVTSSLRWCGAFAQYSTQVRRLSEMAADDYAARRTGRRAVASALLSMSIVEPAGGADPTLAMTGADPAERIRRLLSERASSRRVIALACVGAAGALMFPPVIALAPAIALADSAHCDGQCH